MIHLRLLRFLPARCFFVLALACWSCIGLVLSTCFDVDAQESQVTNDSQSATDPLVSFDTQIMAVLSKNGCNAAACHGASGGRGGLQLSLFGSDPDLDYDQIVRERLGRRIDRRSPEKSLVLLKATESIEHEGGFRFDVDSRAFRLLQLWIDQGAKRIDSEELESIRIEPPTLEFTTAGQTRTFQIFARFKNGIERNVTLDSVATLLDEEALSLSELQLKDERSDYSLTVQRPGQHSVLVRYLDQVNLLQAVLPFPANGALNFEPPADESQFIDAAIDQQLQRLQILPASQADEAVLFRRLTLDLLGRLPDPVETNAFVQSRDTHKIETAVEAMLNDPRFVSLWTWHLSEWLRVGGNGQDESMAEKYQAWIRDQVSGEASLAQLAIQSLTATGDTGATGFYRLTADPGIQAEIACNTWMGVRIGCAQCHNHPLDHWKRNQYFQFAAFFAGMIRDRDIKVTNRSTLINPVTRKPAMATLPDGQTIEADDPRAALAHWMVHGESPYFAEATANRVWSILMGHGIYEPVDDFRQTNPVTNPQLLKSLASFHRDHQFQLRPLIRKIVLSKAYQRRSSPTAEIHQDPFYGRFLPRDLPAPVLLNAIEQLTAGSNESRENWLEVATPNQVEELNVLGQCDRKVNCLPTVTRAANRGLAQNLELISGPVVNERISKKNGFLTEVMATKANAEILAIVYQRAYSRTASEQEQTFWLERFQAAASDESRQQLWEDMLWAVIRSREFSTNH